ncbi:GGDEF domain-containing protein [Cycloclasticus sp. 46_120_T64]|nr:GGDEF domain-containing protein [Cycloclasticus sp. 46_120_T64]
MRESLSMGWGQQALEQASFGVLWLKPDNSYYLNPYLCSILGLDESEAVGEEWLEAGPLASALLDVNSPLQLVDAKGQALWMQREAINKAELRVYFFHNCSDWVLIGNECRRLQGELANLAATSSVQGLINNDVMLQLLDGHISCSRRYLNPLSLLRIRYEFPNDMEAALVSHCIQRIAFFLKDQLRWADQIGMLDSQSFLVILPETDYQSAASLLKKFNDEPHLALFSSDDEKPLSFSIGLTEWRKGDVATKMLKNLQQDVDLTVV